MKLSLPAKQLALQVIREQWADFMAHEPGTLRGEDPEQLHRMRVAHRRLRTALRAFESLLPAQLVAAEPELRWIGRELGRVRDLDVQLGALEQSSAELEPSQGTLNGLMAGAREERERARARLLEVLTGKRFEALVLQVSRCLREQVMTETVPVGPSIGRVAPVMLEKQYRRFYKPARKLTPKSSPGALHRTRRRARRLRFAVEFIEEAYGEPATALIDSVKSLQDLFGAHQDCYAAIDLRRRTGKSLRGAEQELARELDSRDGKRAASLRKTAPDAVRDVRKRWKALKDAMRG